MREKNIHKNKKIIMSDFSEYVFEKTTIDMKKTGKNIRKFRKEKKYSVKEISEYLGISFQSVYNWENGRSYITIDHFIELCNLLNVSYDDLIVLKNVKAVIHNYED